MVRRNQLGLAERESIGHEGPAKNAERSFKWRLSLPDPDGSGEDVLKGINAAETGNGGVLADVRVVLNQSVMVDHCADIDDRVLSDLRGERYDCASQHDRSGREGGFR